MTSSTLPQDAHAARTDSARHSLLDDLQGHLFGVVMLAFGASMLKAAGLITGQFAGLSLLLSHITGWSFGAVFFSINLPFYAFAFRRMGWRFTVKSLLSIAGISLLANVFPQLIGYSHLNPAAAAVLGGFSSGIGLFALFRHGASCGGMGIVALYLQDKTGFRAGWTLLGFDLSLFIAASFVLDTRTMALSLLGAAVLNFGIAMNHRRDRYTAH